MKGVGVSHEKILQILWEDYVTRKKGLQQGAPTTSVAAGTRGVPRKGSKAAAPTILEPGNLDELLYPEVVSMRRKLDYSKGSDDYEDYVVTPPVEKCPFFVRVEKSSYITVDELPEFMEMCFRPPQGMKLTAIEMVVAAYIFWEGLDASLVRTATRCVF
ncbi:hypothetical protein PIB30_036479 [Stylosanthes scabra]|uniref:Uncharacterized protein n=1 Tax=Stylosanthes scabra TaxID=79078 RepID=A0ABU6XDK0_9FABA|nr:hypothetical protein [Stylosanthes scabra]